MENVNLSKFSKLNNTIDYDTLLKHLNPVNKFSNGEINFNKLSYKNVRRCLHLIRDLATWDNVKDLYCIAFEISEEQFWKQPITSYYAAQNYLVKAFTDLQERESKLLSSIGVNSILWESAGGKRLDKFSNLMPLIQLGEIYGVYPYELQNRPYNEILTLLVLHKEKSEVNTEYQKIMSKQKI